MEFCIFWWPSLISLPAPALGNHQFILFCEFVVFRFHIEVRLHSVCYPLSHYPASRRAGISGVCHPLTHTGLPPGHDVHTQTFWISWSFRTKVGSPKCPLVFILLFHWRSSSWAPDQCCLWYTYCRDIQWLLAAHTGACMVNTARHSHCFVHQLLAGMCFWVLGLAGSLYPRSCRG